MLPKCYPAPAAGLAPGARAVPSPVPSRHHRCGSLCSSPLLVLLWLRAWEGKQRDAERAFLGCAIRRRNLGGNRTEGDTQGVGTLLPPACVGQGHVYVINCDYSVHGLGTLRLWMGEAALLGPA